MKQLLTPLLSVYISNSGIKKLSDTNTLIEFC